MSEEKTAKINDLAYFIVKLFAAKTEAEVSELMDETPEIFQEKLWMLLDEIPPLSQIEDLRSQIKQWSKKIILNQARESSKDKISFEEWIGGVPLIPTHIVRPLQDNYHACRMTYENFSDCYSGFDEKSFYKDALEKIERWVNLQ